MTKADLKAAWPEVRLGDFVDLVSGFAFKSELFTNNPEDVHLVKGENLHQGYIDWKNAKRWKANEVAQYERFQLIRGDVVLAMDRPWVEAGLKFSWIKKDDPKALLVQRVARMRGASGLSTCYLRYIIGSSQFTDYIKPIVTGVNVPHISAQQIKDFKFFLPPYPIQCRIASILAAYDDLIENNTRRIQILEEIAQQIYEEWFVRFRFPGHENVNMIESELGLIPDRWETKSVIQMIEFDPRTIVPKEGMKPFVPMSSLAENSMLITNIECRVGNSGSKFKNGDTLLARITPCLENGKTGFVDFLPDDNAVAFGSTEYIVLRSKTVTPEFVYLTARSPRFRQHAIKSMSGATGRQRVQVDCFSEFQLPQPEKSALDKFSEVISAIFKNIAYLSKKNSNLHRTRDLLLPKLILGEIDVSDFPEPVTD